MMPPRHILVPTDFSTRAHHALRYAVGLARNSGGKIEVLHVVPPPSRVLLAAGAYFGLPLPRVADRVLAQATEQLAQFVGSVEHEGCQVDARVEIGDPAATTVEIACEDKNDLIVMSTEGRHGLANLVNGSVAQAVMTTAPCPVVTLR